MKRFSQGRTGTDRPGFSLIELLVVILIICVLMAILGFAASQVVGSQQKAATQILVQKTDGQLQKQWKAVIAQAEKDFKNGRSGNGTNQNIQPVIDLAGADNDRALVLLKCLYLRNAFPVSYAEATTPVSITSPLTGTIYTVPQIQSYLILKPLANAPDTGTQSSACLLLALQRDVGGSGTGFNPEETLGKGSVQDTNGDGINEIVDIYGTPLVFWRFPIANPDFSSNTQRILDPNGKLVNSTANNTWFSANKQGLAAFDQVTGLNVSAGSGIPYCVPVIASCGKDQLPGFSWPSAAPSMPIPPNQNQANDNIYNYTQQQ